MCYVLQPSFQIQGFECARRPFGKVIYYRGVTHCLLSILLQEGALAFYKGTFPATIKVNDVDVFLFLSKDYVSQQCILPSLLIEELILLTVWALYY